VSATDLPLYLLLGILHFTRNVFFALTAFVLIYSYNNKPVSMRKFWPRRFLLVGVPYVVWSVIYFTARTLHSGTHQSLPELGLALLIDILTGVAWYHLYFLLVTMQVYLLMPVLVWLIRTTRGHHVRLLVIVGAVQLAIVTIYYYFPKLVHWANGYTTEVFISYILFIVAGAVAADHQEFFLAWVRSHRKLIAIIVGCTAVVTLGVFLLAIRLGSSYNTAGLPLQPVMMLWATAVALGLLGVGTFWADHRKPGGRGTKFVARASDRSFGIFLSHPLFIWLAVGIGSSWLTGFVAKPWLTLVVYVGVIACAIALTELLRRTPLSLAFTGRPWERRARRASEDQRPPAEPRAAAH
jgi:peptidoglycan/LPS O-acetylase OafA/YrhL